MTLTQYEQAFIVELEEIWADPQTRSAFLHWDNFVYYHWRQLENFE